MMMKNHFQGILGITEPNETLPIPMLFAHITREVDVSTFTGRNRRTKNVESNIWNAKIKGTSHDILGWTKKYIKIA